MRTTFVYICERFEIGALLRGEDGKCLEFLHIDSEDLIEARPVYSVVCHEDACLFEPQA